MVLSQAKRNASSRRSSCSSRNFCLEPPQRPHASVVVLLHVELATPPISAEGIASPQPPSTSPAPSLFPMLSLNSLSPFLYRRPQPPPWPWTPRSCSSRIHRPSRFAAVAQDPARSGRIAPSLTIS